MHTLTLRLTPDGAESPLFRTRLCILCRMLSLTLTCICLLLGTSLAASVQSRMSSFAGEYGGGGGTAFSFSSEQIRGAITGIRVRENPSHVLGLQFRYGSEWGSYFGNPTGTLFEVLLAHGENITQVSGKTAAYVNELLFVTSHGRILRFGQPSGNSFNDFPLYPGTTLRYVSGRYSTVILSIGFHWGVQPSCTYC
uniref:Jacalin-type lectin domain-containing protein n=1 Tax=Leptobrachium leishanense TaxID=445787 RepID=A0A8C5QGX1_9ANUR